MTSNQINYFKAKLEEAHYARSDAENARHNYAVEQISREQNEELRRSNLAREAETHRSNVASETNYYANLVENARHNRVTEAYTGENLAITAERSQYQNLYDSARTQYTDTSSRNLDAERTLIGYKATGQDIANQQATLDYNLNNRYAEAERLTSGISNVSVLGVNVGGIGKSLVNVITGLNSMKSSKNKLPYYTLKQ